MKGKIITRIEKLAIYLAENSVEKSIPIFSYKVKKPDDIEKYIQQFRDNGKSKGKF